MDLDTFLGLGEEHLRLREKISDFAERRVAPTVVEADREERFPSEVFAELGAEGWLGGTIPKEYGGLGLDNISLAVMVETLGRYSQIMAAALGGVSTVFGTGLTQFGTEEQRQRYLTPYIRGEMMGALALTESRSGSDPAGMETSARKVDGGWEISGAKAWIDAAGSADWFVTFAQADAAKGRDGITAFLVERGADGVSTEEYRNKLGWRGASVGGISFDSCFVPDSALLGEVGGGYRIAMAAVGYGRMMVAARMCGGIRACLDASREFALNRRIFGQTVADFQLTQTRIVDMATALDNSRFLTYRLAGMLDAGDRARREGSMAKLYVAEAFMRSSHDAVQIHGATGIGEESIVGRMFRDAKVSEIVEGSNEIQRTLIARYELAS